MAVVCAIPLGQFTQEAPVNSSIKTTRLFFRSCSKCCLKEFQLPNPNKKQNKMEIKEDYFSYFLELF